MSKKLYNEEQHKKKGSYKQKQKIDCLILKHFHIKKRRIIIRLMSIMSI